MGRQAFRYPQESKATSRVTWEDPWNVLPSSTSFFPQFCVLCCEIEYPCCQLGSAVLACLFLASCAPPVFSLVGGDAKQEKVLTLSKHCSAVIKTMCVTNICRHKIKPSPLLATLKKINSIPAKTSAKRKRDV